MKKPGNYVIEKQKMFAEFLAYIQAATNLNCDLQESEIN